MLKLVPRMNILILINIRLKYEHINANVGTV